MWPHLILAALLAQPAGAETVVATRTLRAHTLISANDVRLVDGIVPGAATAAEEVVGRETRIAIYKDAPVGRRDIGPPAIVERNQRVPLLFADGPLAIATEGRALDRGGEGDVIRVMNTGSRKTVSGIVLADGTVAVQPAQ